MSACLCLSPGHALAFFIFPAACSRGSAGHSTAGSDAETKGRSSGPDKHLGLRQFPPRSGTGRPMFTMKPPERPSPPMTTLWLTEEQRNQAEMLSVAGHPPLIHLQNPRKKNHPNKNFRAGYGNSSGSFVIIVWCCCSRNMSATISIVRAVFPG